MNELIQNPDLRVGFYDWEAGKPLFSHFEVEHASPLTTSENPIINKLLVRGYEVHETLTSYWFGFPTFAMKLTSHFVAQQRREFQIRLNDDGFLRFRFEGEREVYLSLFYIHKHLQGNGLGRKWFKPITDSLFRAGVRSMRGAVSPSYYESKRSMNVKQLTQFYTSEAGFTATGDGYIFKRSPFLKKTKAATHSSPKSDATETRKASDIARIS